MADTVSISVKHSDMAFIEFQGVEHHGYMPHVGIFGGDYTELEIDNETGTIIGWKPLEVVDGKFKTD